MRLQRLNMIVLEVSDADRSVRWYRRMLGLRPMAGSATPTLIGADDFTLSLVAGTPQRARRFLMGLRLASRREVREWRSHLDSNGAFAAPIAEREGSYGFTLADPDGYVLEFSTSAMEE